MKRSFPIQDGAAGIKTKIGRQTITQEENKMKKTLRLIVICGLTLAVTNTVAWAQQGPALSTELQSITTATTGTVEVLIQFYKSPAGAQHAAVEALGGTLIKAMPHIKAAHYLVPISSLKALLKLPNVKYISSNRRLKASFDQITDGTVH